MRKFPVTTEKGNEYAVSIYYHYGFNVKIYKKRKGFMGLFRFKRLKHYGLYSERFERKFDSDYIKLAKHYVNRYEREVEENKQAIFEDKIKRQEFEEWDGKI